MCRDFNDPNCIFYSFLTLFKYVNDQNLLLLNGCICAEFAHCKLQTTYKTQKRTQVCHLMDKQCITERDDGLSNKIKQLSDIDAV